jgi:membrane protein DedA with SNARE-associated domain
MSPVADFVSTWGYTAIFLIVVSGNIGIPVPEETILTVGGYLAWRGQLRFSIVVLVGMVSAVLGDNIGYWLGRRYGRRLLARWSIASPARLERMQGFVVRYGAIAVFGARFIAGLRFMAGPLAGSTGLDPTRFFVANLLGAMVYVPVIVGAGYAIGYGFGDRIERLRKMVANTEHIVLISLVLVTAISWIVVVVHARRRRGDG